MSGGRCQQVEWAEDDFILQAGVERLLTSEPCSGKIYLMFHGTDKKHLQSIRASGLHQSEDGMLGRGVYLSRDLAKASRYPLKLDVSERVVIMVQVKVGKVIRINHKGHPYQKSWYNLGYDTAWVPPYCGMVPSGLEENCVWDPNRIEIIDYIQPRLQQQPYASGCCDNMYRGRGQQVQWAENDFALPAGVQRLVTSAPCSGNAYIMYHGTNKKHLQSILASGLRQSEDGMLGRGVYLSRDLEKASRYPLELDESERVVIRVQVQVGKVIVINHQRHPKQKSWHSLGYDSAWVPPDCGMVQSGLEENCVWDPKQIKIIDYIQPATAYDNMYRGQQVQWAENDFALPAGVQRLVTSEPCSGNTYIMYHGTNKKHLQSILASGLRQSEGGMLGRGVYLSRDLEKASRYPLELDVSERVVIRVHVQVGKVIIINRQHHPHQKSWHNLGYDSAWVPPDCGMVRSGLEENCVWDPKQIKIIDYIQPRLQQQLYATPCSENTYIMYHGTNKKHLQSILASGLRQSEDGMLGRGVYLSRDLEKASRYPLKLDESERVVIRVHVQVGKVIIINCQHHPHQKSWHDLGYDSAWVPPDCGMVRSGLEENCVWDPKQIKIIDYIQPRLQQQPYASACGW
ncbi:uncharacterized protein LOC142992603 [Genypterus blacodes]|uniref:uncharacterized protein LOC142992603 n=1 Tax=Genypterus blacodes TaxID=154954 RepID=UPI003F77631B